MKLESIILSFQLFFPEVVTDITVTFQPPEKMMWVNDPKGRRRAHASCTPRIATVEVNQDHWQSINTYQKQELIWHELGHCLLSLDHTIEPNRIMNPFPPKAVYWVKPDGSNWEELKANLRKHYLKQGGGG